MTRSRLQIAAIVAVSILALVGVVGYFAIPAAARWGIETVGSRELGRTVRVESISANPYALRVTVKGLTVEGLPGEPAPLLTVQQATVNASISSVLQLAPVIDAVKIDGLSANIVRLEAQRFSFDDIIERLRAKPKKDDDKPAGFAVGNIEVAGSLVNFDDRVTGRKHALSDIAIGIPFISNLPVDVEVKVLPSFSAKLNGSPIAVAGETRPFHDTLESSINVKLDGLDIPTYLAYSPVRLNFTVPRGSLDTDLRIAFRRAAPASGDKPAQAAQTLVSGALVVNGFVLAAPAASAQPLIGWKSLRVVLDEVDPFARRAVIGDIALSAPTVELVRDVSGAINWVQFGKQPLLETPKPASAAKPTESAAPAAGSPPPFAVTLKHAAVNQGTVNYTDDSAGRFQLQVVNLAAEASDLTTTSNARGKARVTGDIAEGHGSVKLEGEVGLAPVGGRLALEARDVRLRAAARYLANVVSATLDGQSDVNAVVEFAAAESAMKIAVREIAVRSKDITLRGPAGSGANFDLAAMTIDGAELDLNTRQITVARLSLDGPRAMVRRLPDGQINWLTVFRAKPGQTTGTTEKQEGAAAEPWNVTLKEAAIARGDLQLEDLAMDPNVKLRMSAITGTVSNVVSDGSQRAEFALRTRFGSGGTLVVNGGARWNPLASDLRVDARSLDIAAVRPYLAARLNAVLASALLSARGNVAVNQATAGAPLKVAYKGSGRLANLHMLDARSENDLLKWQVLDLEQITAKIGDPPPEVTVGKVSLADFYARVIVSDQGRLNLADLIRREGQPATELAPKAESKPPSKPSATTKPAEVSTPVDREMAGSEPAQAAAQSRTATATVAEPAVDPSAPRPVIRIGQIEVARGNVNFTDNFIKPNYTANMTGLGGTVTTLASDATEPATMTLAGMIDDDAPLDISGRLNPLAPKLFLDIEGRTKGVDLPRLTPYSLKYAGYPILKGKLSMEVKYKVEDEKLNANNHLFLDQLTFGDKVDSPTATKLPVLLAVSLLKNTRGEIDINLPVSGTLNDPKFSVGGIIIQVIINVLTKIVTAPFALLASAFGGGEELGYVEFAAGSATLSAEQTKRIDTLAKALNDRPALKLDIIGRVDPSVDTEGARKAKLDAKLRAAKVQQVVRGGGESVDPAKVTITEQERPALIAAVYAEEKIPDKPRNFIGIAKTVPAPEMETLIVTNLAVTPEDLRALANQRATVVRNRLETEGKISRERLFLVEPKLTTEGIKDQGAKTRVDFSLK